MAELRVTITGDLEGEFVIQEEHSDGTLVVVRAEVWGAEQRRESLDRAQERNSLSEDEAIALGVKAVHEARAKRQTAHR